MYDTPTLQQFESNKMFKRLSDCLSAFEYTDLEESIAYRRITVTIPVWNNIILWNYPHYRICQRWKVPYNIKKYDFYNEADATVEVCCNILDNPPASTILVKYTYGLLYENLKQISHECFKTKNHFYTLEDIRGKIQTKRHKSVIGSAISRRYPPSASTLFDYNSLYRSINHIIEVVPIIESHIFAAETSFTGASLKKIAQKSNNDIKLELINYARKQNDNRLLEELTKPTTAEAKITKHRRTKNTPQIKDMPTYDPDAEISSLTYTISAWINSLIRAIKISNLDNASIEALKRVDKQLEILTATIRKLRRMIKEILYEKRQ